MDPSRIFRKVALDRMSSPEQLDVLLQVTTPRTWLALLSLIVCLLAAVTWGLWGELTTKVSAQGTLAETRVAGQPPALEARVYVAAEDAGGLEPGMDAEVIPAGARREEHGVLRGTVSMVADVAAASQLGESRRSAVEVHVRLTPAADTPSGYAWTTRLGAPIVLRAGTPCDAEIITERSRPASLMVPGLATGSRPR